VEWNEKGMGIGMGMRQEEDENGKEIKGKVRQRNTKRSEWAVGERGKRMGIVIISGMEIGMGMGQEEDGNGKEIKGKEQGK
jgi:hypothetical protein